LQSKHIDAGFLRTVIFNVLGVLGEGFFDSVERQMQLFADFVGVGMDLDFAGPTRLARFLLAATLHRDLLASAVSLTVLAIPDIRSFFLMNSELLTKI